MAYPDFSDLKLRVRDLLGESTAAFYSDTEIGAWLNDGESDVAAKGLCLESVQALSIASARTVAVTIAPVKIMYVEYVPGSGTPIGLVEITPLMMGHLDTTGLATPQFWFPWGAYVAVEPKPATTYSLNAYTAILPQATMSADADEPSIQAKFIPLLVKYAYIQGLLKDRRFAMAGLAYREYISTLQRIRQDMMEKYANIRNEEYLPDIIRPATASQ